MSRPAIVILGLLAIFVIASIAILSFKPAILGPVDQNSLSNNPMPIIRDQSITKNMESNLPVLAESMPDFQGITRWWNTTDNKPLSKEDLKGKVVMIDFWTYSCINCIRTQPFMRKIWDAYKDDGLVIVGVHTPEFAFEKVASNVEQAIKKAGLLYPIALDPNYETWNAYNNRYWPAAYFFDRQGRLRVVHFGEGEYDKQEDVIRQLLQEGGSLDEAPIGDIGTPNFAMTRTPETYFGHQRFTSFANADQFKPDAETTYTLRATGSNEWSIGGTWDVTGEYAAATKAGDTFRMNVESNAMYLVLGSKDGPRGIKVTIDGKAAAPIIVEDKQLYTIARFPEGGRHTVDLEIVDAGVEFYAATFGE